MSKITIIEGNSDDKDQVRNFMVKGERGYSAYDLYVQHGGQLTEEEWLEAFLNASNYYTKDETDGLLEDKADSSTTLSGYGITDAYTKDETDGLLENIVNDSYSTSTTETYSSNYINNIVADVYSENEVKTNKVWIDDKPIYRKVYFINALPDTTTLNIDISTWDIETITDLKGISNTGLVFNGNRGDGSQFIIDLYADLSRDSIILITYQDRTDMSGYIILEYTKTTD